MGCIDTKIQKELRNGNLITCPSSKGTQIFLSSEDNLHGIVNKIQVKQI
jgi:hypothetical protein